WGEVLIVECGTVDSDVVDDGSVDNLLRQGGAGSSRDGSSQRDSWSQDLLPVVAMADHKVTQVSVSSGGR
ncbi:hypothetical protein Dimus_001867, partial [Dionaea muscipula]